MNQICLFLFILGIATQIESLRVQVSVKSNIKRKLKIKDFTGCEGIRESLIHPQCIIEGITEEKDRKELCDAYTKDLEKLDCKDTCEEFYKKLNKANIKYAEAQAEYFKTKKDDMRADRCKASAKDQKNSEEGFVESHCFADMTQAGESLEDAFEDKDKKKEKE